MQGCVSLDILCLGAGPGERSLQTDPWILASKVLRLLFLLDRHHWYLEDIDWIQYQDTAQPAIGVIGNIGFPSSRNKEELIIPPFTKDEFTRSRQ